MTGPQDLEPSMTDTLAPESTIGDVVTLPPTFTASGAGTVDRAEGMPRETVFDLSDVEVYYSGFRAVTNVNLDVTRNEISAFIGPSGCGKTTVLRALNRMHDLTPGGR
jgi:phosphate transport system ATP-binding protein